MKRIILLIMCVFTADLSFAGNDSGGGGHPCKADFTKFFYEIDGAFAENKQLAESYPKWNSLRKVMIPELNPGLELHIFEKEIKDCSFAQNPIACAIPSQNQISLYCGPNGWDSLSTEEKYKYIIHELYWWESREDANFYFSQKMAKDIHEYLNVQKCEAELNLKIRLMTFHNLLRDQCNTTKSRDFYFSSQRLARKTEDLYQSNMVNCRRFCNSEINETSCNVTLDSNVCR